MKAAATFLSSLLIVSTPALAADFRVAPDRSSVASMNDADLCKQNYVRNLDFINAEVAKRFLDCDKVLKALVAIEMDRRAEEQAKREAAIKAAYERKQREAAAEIKRQRERAEAERVAAAREAEQQRLQALQAQYEAQRRMEERQLELMREQVKAQREAADDARRAQGFDMLMRSLNNLNSIYTPPPKTGFTCIQTGNITNCN